MKSHLLMRRRAFGVVAMFGLAVAVLSLGGCDNIFGGLFGNDGGGGGGSDDAAVQEDDPAVQDEDPAGEDNGSSEEDNGSGSGVLGIPSDELEVDEGSVGLVVDTRSMFKKGYIPATVDVVLEGAFASYSDSLTVDPDTSLATLEIENEDLTSDEITTLGEGINVTITVRNADGDQLGSYSGKEPVDDSNRPLSVDTSLGPNYPETTITPGQPYLLQVVDGGSSYDQWIFQAAGGATSEVTENMIVSENYNLIVDAAFSYLVEFYFEEAPDGYYIKGLNGDEEDTYLHWESDGQLISSGDATLPSEDFKRDDYVFELLWTDSGLLVISPKGGNPFAASDTGSEVQIVEGTGSGDALSVRIFAANIEWSVEDRGTRYNRPIRPPAKLDFAFNSILRNCSSGRLTETVENSKEVTRSLTTASEESFELYSSTEESISVTSTVEVGGGFKGISASASVSATGSYSYTTASTSATTNTWEETNSETNSVTISREVELEPFTAVEVYNAIATYENIRIPFVQTLRVRGKYDGVAPLSGEEIVFQLLGNLFGGVVSVVGTEYVDVQVRGTAEIANFYDAQAGVAQIADPCSDASD